VKWWGRLSPQGREAGCAKNVHLVAEYERKASEAREAQQATRAAKARLTRDHSAPGAARQGLLRVPDTQYDVTIGQALRNKLTVQ
jgi:hypothetical protein